MAKAGASRITTKRRTKARNPDLWSAEVTRKSDALDLEEGVFRKRSALQTLESAQQELRKAFHRD